MITDVEGLRVGHWTDPVGRTGCTVVVFPEGTVASGEVRGGAPASREFALLHPGRTVERLDALVLTGGSAFGLATADGVMRWAEEQGRGFPTPAARVPIVVALSLFDLGVGDAAARPDAAAGHAACLSAAGGPVDVGTVGAGTGATVGKGLPGVTPRPGGLVTASAAVGHLRVGALVAVNASGVPGGDAAAIATDPRFHDRQEWPEATNTTIGVVATNARLDKVGCHRLAQGAHDGLARSVFPPHTRYDGDAFVAASVGPGEARVAADADVARALAVHVVERAVLTLVD